MLSLAFSIVVPSKMPHQICPIAGGAEVFKHHLAKSAPARNDTDQPGAGAPH